eukprot:5765956-Pleurochrysis_carterae.AAC.2
MTNIRWPTTSASRLLELSNISYPKDGSFPFLTEDTIQVRFAHPCEYESDAACTLANCGIIMPSADRYIIVEETFSFIQETSRGRKPCAIDFYMWVPASPHNEVFSPTDDTLRAKVEKYAKHA